MKEGEILQVSDEGKFQLFVESSKNCAERYFLRKSSEAVMLVIGASPHTDSEGFDNIGVRITDCGMLNS